MKKFEFVCFTKFSPVPKLRRLSGVGYCSLNIALASVTGRSGAIYYFHTDLDPGHAAAPQISRDEGEWPLVAHVSYTTDEADKCENLKSLKN